MNPFWKKNKLYLIALCAGVLLLLFAGRSPGGETNSDAARLKQILSHAQGIGKLEVMVSKDENQRAEGVIVVAQGADDPAIKMQICEAAQTAFGVPLHKIQIYTYKKGKD